MKQKHALAPLGGVGPGGPCFSVVVHTAREKLHTMKNNVRDALIQLVIALIVALRHFDPIKENINERDSREEFRL